MKKILLSIVLLLSMSLMFYGLVLTPIYERNAEGIGHSHRTIQGYPTEAPEESNPSKEWQAVVWERLPFTKEQKLTGLF